VPLFELDPDRIFEGTPFNNDESLEMLADAAADALKDNGSLRIPQSDVEEAIYLVRAQIVFFQTLGVLTEREGLNMRVALDTHLRFVKSLREPDMYSELDRKYLPRKEGVGGDGATMDTGVNYYNYRNISRRRVLEEIETYDLLIDYVPSLAAYTLHVASRRWRAAFTTAAAIALMGVLGPMVSAPLASIPGGFALPWLGTIALEYTQLRRLEQTATVNALRTRRGAALRAAALAAREQEADTFLGSIRPPPPGADVTRDQYTSVFAQIARELYAGTTRARIGTFAVTVGAAIADFYSRYKPERCREWLRMHSNIARPNQPPLPDDWLEELEVTVNELRRFASPQLQGAAPPNAQTLRNAYDEWIKIIVGSTEDSIDRERDPCERADLIDAHFRVFVNEQIRLESDPLLADQATRTLLVAWSKAKAAFEKEIPITVPMVPDQTYHAMVALYRAPANANGPLVTAFYANPGGDAQRRPVAFLNECKDDLQNLTTLLQDWKSNNFAALNDGPKLAALQQKYAAVGVGGGRGRGGGGRGGGGRPRRAGTNGSIDALCDAFLAARFAK
jgi:hypothetical protein